MTMLEVRASVALLSCAQSCAQLDQEGHNLPHSSLQFEPALLNLHAPDFPPLVYAHTCLPHTNRIT